MTCNKLTEVSACMPRTLQIVVTARASGQLQYFAGKVCRTDPHPLRLIDRKTDWRVCYLTLISGSTPRDVSFPARSTRRQSSFQDHVGRARGPVLPGVIFYTVCIDISPRLFCSNDKTKCQDKFASGSEGTSVYTSTHFLRTCMHFTARLNVSFVCKLAWFM